MSFYDDRVSVTHHPIGSGFDSNSDLSVWVFSSFSRSFLCVRGRARQAMSATLHLAEGLSVHLRDHLYAAPPSPLDVRDGSKPHLELEQREKTDGWINVCITASFHHHPQRVDE